MKILVVSDTHGRYDKFLKHINKEKFDAIFHLGDYVEDGEYISKKLDIQSTIIMGNGDYGKNYNEDEIIEINGKKIFLTHGHIYNVRFGVSNLYYRGKELGVDLVLFGHTHIPINVKENGIRIMNPGSPSFPRGRDIKYTYGIVSIEKEIKTEIIELE